MAQFYVPGRTRRDFVVLSTTVTVEGLRAAGTTIPSGVWFEIFEPFASLQAVTGVPDVAIVNARREALAEGIEANINPSRASSAVFIEDVDANGLIKFLVQFTVEIPPPTPAQIGPFTTTIDVPATALEDQEGRRAIVAPLFTAAIAGLTELATA